MRVGGVRRSAVVPRRVDVAEAGDLRLAEAVRRSEEAGEVEKRGPKPPVYDPEEDALYDFEEEGQVVDEMDMDDLDDVKLDIEWGVCYKAE